MRTWLLTCCSAVVLSSPALAQDRTGGAGPDKAAPTASADASAQTSSAGGTDSGVAPQATSGIADIVVTAQRRGENLQKAALAVSAVDGRALSEAGVVQPQDLSKLVPALKLSATGGGGTQVTVRGVGNFSGNPYAEPAVAVNLDGVYLARSGGPNGLFYDLQRVEVLKGPQGTLYGRNATAGALNIITNKPQDYLSVSGGIDLGDYNLRRGVLAVNVPLSDDVALRVAGTITRRDGYFKDGYSDDRSEGARGQLKVAATERLSILLSADYAHQGGKGPGAVFAPYLSSNPYNGPTRDGSNALLANVSLAVTGGATSALLPPFTTNGFVDVKNWGTSGTFEYKLGGVSLTILPAYRRSDSEYLHYNAGFPVQSSEHSRATSVETRLASTNDAAKLKWLLGGYYFNEDLNFKLYANQGVAFNRTEPVLNTRSLAAFGQATYSLTDTLRLTGGVRYTNERKTQGGQNGGPPPPVPTGFPGTATAFYTLACSPYDQQTGTCFAPLQGDLTQNQVTWKAGAEYDVGPRSLLYANVATGFKAGGFYGSLPPNTFKPEKLTAYTIGSKNRFFDNTLQLNGEAFFWKYNDKQVTHLGPIRPGGFNLITENAGSATIYGAEVDAVWQPRPSDVLTVNVQYLHTRYDNFTYTQTTVAGPPQTACPITPISGQAAVIVDCTGRPLPLSPTWTANLSYRHSFAFINDSKLDALVGTRIEGGYYVGEEFLPGEYQTSNTVSNASLTWRLSGDRFTLGAFVENIEDRAVKSSGFAQPVVGLPIVILRPPRTFGVRGTFEFR